MKKPKPLNNRPKLVVIGGGTGSFTLLSEFKRWTDQLTAIVNMADDGGSSGELRDELGVEFVQFIDHSFRSPHIGQPVANDGDLKFPIGH